MGVRVANNRRPFTPPLLPFEVLQRCDSELNLHFCICRVSIFCTCLPSNPFRRLDSRFPAFDSRVPLHNFSFSFIDKGQGPNPWVDIERENTARCRSLLHFFNGWFPKMLEFVIWNTFEALPPCMCECMWGNIHYIVTKAPITSTTTGIQAWSNFATFLFGVYLKKHPSEEENKCLMKLFQKKEAETYKQRRFYIYRLSV